VSTARYDVLIQGGELIDGSGHPRVRADVAVRDGRVVAVSSGLSGQARQVIDARGQIVSPGFVDIHTHSDATLVLDGNAESAVRQGVTTQICGNCGVSLFPVGPNGPELNFLANATVREHLKVEWTTAAGYFGRLEQEGISINVGFLTGHGALRHAVGALGPAASPEQRASMRSLLAESLEMGALGLSSGLTYAPGCFANETELVELAQVAADHNGVYATHLRAYNAALIPAVQEAISVGRAAGVPVQVSHLNPCPPMQGSGPQLLDMLAQARAQGIDVACDIEVYSTGCTSLKSLCPPWALAGGDVCLLERLRDPAQRDRIRLEILEKGSETGGSTKQVLMQRGEWDKLWLGNCQVNRAYSGKSFADIARLRGEDPFEMVFNVLLEEQGVATFFGQDKSEADIEAMLHAPFVSLISDGFILSRRGLLAKEIDHPRCYGAFPWAIRRYVRERRTTTLEELIHHSTALPAARFGLTGRGTIQEGAWADIVVFDEQMISDRGALSDPAQYPVGITAVLVNGQIVFANGEHTGARPGQVLCSGHRRQGLCRTSSDPKH
jgi:N-acyl-D-amino-acid deacylase